MCEIVCQKVKQIHSRGSKSHKKSLPLRCEDMEWAKDSGLYNTHLLSFEENNNKENNYKAFCGGND